MDGEGQKAENTNIQPPAATEIREDLVATAVKFLQNAKVRQSPFPQRKAFLVRKGLSETEIAEAIKRSGTEADESAVSVTPPLSQASAQPINNTVVAHGTAPLPVQRTYWDILRDALNLATFIGGLIYALYQFYRHFLMKWLFGQSGKEAGSRQIKSKDIDSLEKQMNEVTTSVMELKQVVSQTNEQVQSFVKNSARNRGDTELNRMNVTEIKDEIRSLKSLLLSKKQFPPVPSTSPVLPSWQLQSTSKSSKDSDSDTSTGGVGETVSHSDRPRSGTAAAAAVLEVSENLVETTTSMVHGETAVHTGATEADKEADKEAENESEEIRKQLDSAAAETAAAAVDSNIPESS